MPEQHEEIHAPLRELVSRSAMLRATALGIAAAAIPGAAGAAAGPQTISFPFYPQVQGTYTTEGMASIISDLLTSEYLLVTSRWTILATHQTTVPLSGLLLEIVQADTVAVQYHIDFLQALFPGVQPVTTTFQGRAYRDLANFLTRATNYRADMIGQYLAAIREFAELGQPLLAKYMGQILGTHAELRALYRAALVLNGDQSYVPPNNKAFETDTYLTSSGSVDRLKGLGFIFAPGPSTPYPGRDAIMAIAGPMAQAVIQTRPNNATTNVTAAQNPDTPQR